MATTPRLPITCHILDTQTGTPAPGVPITLTLLQSSTTTQPTTTYNSSTNSDGRIETWTPSSSTPFTQNTTSLHELFTSTSGEMLWSIKFETRKYWEEKGLKPFFPEVEIKFLTEGFEGKDGVEEHWHVPLLMTPFTYTTYRGS